MTESLIKSSTQPLASGWVLDEFKISGAGLNFLKHNNLGDFPVALLRCCSLS